MWDHVLGNPPESSRPEVEEIGCGKEDSGVVDCCHDPFQVLSASLAIFGGDSMTEEDSGSDCRYYLVELRMNLNRLPIWFESL